MHRKTLVVSLMASSLLVSVFALGGDKAKVKGMIRSRTGETLIVKSGDGNTTVVLTDDTRTKDDKGLFGLDKQYFSNVVLIPGLKVKVEGTSDDQGRVVAKTITVDGDDLETAQMIQAGLNPTAEQVAANVATLDTHGKGIATNRQDIDTNKEGIAGNKNQLGAHRERIAT